MDLFNRTVATVLSGAFVAGGICGILGWPAQVVFGDRGGLATAIAVAPVVLSAGTVVMALTFFMPSHPAV